MIEWNIWEEVLLQAARLGDVEVLDARASDRLAQRFSDRYVQDPQSRWWWESLRTNVVPIVFDYGDLDAWAIIQSRVPQRRSYVLVVTDEEANPRGAVRGSFEKLRALVAELPYFEYLVTDDDASFGIFDTHHNVVIELQSNHTTGAST